MFIPFRIFIRSLFYRRAQVFQSPRFSGFRFLRLRVQVFEVANFTIYEKFWSNCSFIPLRFWSARIVVVIAKTEASNKQQEMAYTFFSLKKIDNL